MILQQRLRRTAIRRYKWVFKVDKAVKVGTTEVLAKCTRQFARIVKKSAKFHLNQEKIVRFIARTVFLSTRIAVVNL
jgi:hypothetical protein